MTTAETIVLSRQTFVGKAMSLLFNMLSCHPAYLTYIQSRSWEMLGWKKHKLESRLLGEISITLGYADDTTLMAEREEED